MTCLTSDNSLKYRLCVALYRVSFHTLSIGFKWGLYGGRKNSRIDFLCLYSQGFISLAWCHRVLSRTRIILFRDLFRLTRRLRNDKKVVALKTGDIILENRPSAEHTAPNTLILFRVGARSKVGSLFSGGIHLLHLEPCCWKWHSSSNHSSVLCFLSIFRSFFICLLTDRVALCNNRSGFSIAKPKLMKEPLALAYTNIYPITLLKVVAQHLSIPKVLSVAQFTWRLSQVFAKFSADFGRKLRWSAGTGRILQSCKSTFIKSLNPVLHRARTMAKPFCHIITGMSLRNQQNAMQSMVVAGILGTYNFLFQCNAHIPWGINSKFSHSASFRKQRYSFFNIHNKLCRYV